MNFHCVSTSQLLPGDTAAMSLLARSFVDTSEDIAVLRRRLSRIRHSGMADVWKGPAADVFAGYVEALPDDLAKVSESYAEAGAALHDLANETVGRRLEMDRIVSAGRTTHDRIDETQREISGLVAGPPEAQEPRLTELENDLAVLRGELRRHEHAAIELQERQRAACKRGVDRLDRAASLGLQNRNWLQRRGDDLDRLRNAFIDAYEELEPLITVVAIVGSVVATGGLAVGALGALKAASTASLIARWIDVAADGEPITAELVFDSVVTVGASGLKAMNRAVLDSKHADILAAHDYFESVGDVTPRSLNHRFWMAAQVHEDTLRGVDVLGELPGAVRIAADPEAAANGLMSAYRRLDDFLGADAAEDLEGEGYLHLDEASVYTRRCTVEVDE